MSQEIIGSVIKLLAVTLVVIPWWLYRSLRGLPFDDEVPPEGQRGTFYWWAVTILWLLFVILALLLGGLHGLLLFLGAVAGLALLWALVWTLVQSFNKRRARPFLRFHHRFLANFRVALIELPARFIDGL